VVAVDVHPAAIEAARANAERNGVAERVEVRYSNVFSEVDGAFDLIVFDPPFRWFRPRDLTETAITDEG
jgi:release factor glutamine methyltransferase